MYAEGVPYRIIEDIYSAGLSPCYLELLRNFKLEGLRWPTYFAAINFEGFAPAVKNTTHLARTEINIGRQISTQ